MLWQSVALWFIEYCVVPIINTIYCSVIKHLMHQWIVYHLNHLFSFCCMWYPFAKKTDGLEFSSDDGLCSGSTFSAGTSYPNGKFVEKFCASKKITASSCCLCVCVMFMKNSMNSVTTVHTLGSYGKYCVKGPKTCGNTHMASGCLSSQQLSLSSALFLAPNQAATCSSIELKMALSMQTQHLVLIVIFLTTPTNSSN